MLAQLGGVANGACPKGLWRLRDTGASWGTRRPARHRSRGGSEAGVLRGPLDCNQPLLWRALVEERKRPFLPGCWRAGVGHMLLPRHALAPRPKRRLAPERSRRNCQPKVEMSPFVPSREVPFGLGDSVGVGALPGVVWGWFVGGS